MEDNALKIVIVGKGGREHALARALADSPRPLELFACPGSDGISEFAAPVSGMKDPAALVKWMKEQRIDLCVAGEEAWLALGLADACAKANIPCWGPLQEAAQLESSKIYAKEFMTRHQVPTGGFEVVDNIDAARAAVSSYPTVLKYNGLAAGKGVAVCTDEEGVEEFLDLVFTQNTFGKDRVFVEEFLAGREVSVICAVSGGEYLYFTPARDYKRLGDGDAGPNTGGMGAVASRQLLDADLLAKIEREIIIPTVNGLEKDELNYKGFLYFGIILTEQGPKVLEFNCRFGDPEAQAVLPIVEGDFAGFLLEGAKGTLKPKMLQFDEGWSLCLVKASAGYPQSSRSGDVISGLDQVGSARVYHAGTKKNEAGDFETNGGRVLAVSDRAPSLSEVREKAYSALDVISFDGEQCRRDIGSLHFEDVES